MWVLGPVLLLTSRVNVVSALGFGSNKHALTPLWETTKWEMCEQGREREPACWVVSAVAWSGLEWGHVCDAGSDHRHPLTQVFPFMAEEAEMQRGWGACSQFTKCSPHRLSVLTP